MEANVELYNSLYAKIKEAGISAASKSANVRIVDPARIPEEPVRPRRVLNLPGGLSLLILVALFRHSSAKNSTTKYGHLRMCGTGLVALTFRSFLSLENRIIRISISGPKTGWPRGCGQRREQPHKPLSA